MSLAVELVVVAVILAVVFRMRQRFQKELQVNVRLLSSLNQVLDGMVDERDQLLEDVAEKDVKIDSLKATINLDRNLIIEMEDELNFIRKEMVRLVKAQASEKVIQKVLAKKATKTDPKLKKALAKSAKLQKKSLTLDTKKIVKNVVKSIKGKK